jgi:hypothetical protein
MEKKGDFSISFGMIFSIILIIIFIIFAFWAIQKFLGIQNSAEAGKFVGDLQADIDKIWKGSEGSQQQEYFIPSKVKYVCFADYISDARGKNLNFFKDLNPAFNGEENLFFFPIGSANGLDSVTLKHIDLGNTTAVDNPLCFDNIKGKVHLTIKKSFGEALVRIVR